MIANLYPFAETAASDASEQEIVEKIDIGGPSMVRAAAKNHASVAVVVDPLRYGETIAAAGQGGFTLAQRKRLAALAFAHTAAYDTAVARWTAQEFDTDFDAADLPAPPVVSESRRKAHFPPYAYLALERVASCGTARTPTSLQPSTPSRTPPQGWRRHRCSTAKP